MKILVIIPAYNEQDSIMNVIKSIESLDNKVDYVVINDCSKDNTLKVLKENNANFVDLKINLGIGGGVQTGYKYAYENDYDIAIQIDGDGQHNPQYIKDIVVPIEQKKANMVIGSRFIEKEGFQSSFMRRLGINWLSFVIKILSGKKVCDVTSGYRAADRELIKLFKDDYAQDFPEPEAIIRTLGKGYKISEVPVVMEERQGGVSSIRAFKTIYYMIKVTLALIVCKSRKNK